MLPGERFTADQQCMLKYGKDSVRAKSQELSDICRDLHCFQDRFTWTSHPALEGTLCGKMMVCLKYSPNRKLTYNFSGVEVESVFQEHLCPIITCLPSK